MYRYTTFYLPIFQLMDIWTVDFWLLWIILLRLFTHNFLYGHTFSFLLGMCLKGELQGPVVGSSMLTLLQNCQAIFQSGYIIVCSYCEQCRRVPIFLPPSQQLLLVVFLILSSWWVRSEYHWFVFPWGLMMLSIFLYASWLFEHLP